MSHEQAHHAADRAPDDVRLRPFIVIGAVLIVIAVLASAWSWRMAAVALPQTITPETVPPRVAGITLGLISHAADARIMRERQAQRLREYGWIPDEPGFVRIPIDQAKAAWLAQEQR